MNVFDGVLKISFREPRQLFSLFFNTLNETQSLFHDGNKNNGNSIALIALQIRKI